MRLAFVMFLLVPLLMINMTSAKPTSAEFEVGQKFPDIVLPSLEDGRPTSVAKFRGQKIILHIFASW